MKIIFNKYIPFKGFLAINLFGVLFVRKKGDNSNPVLSESTINHEKIHTEQMKEMGYIFFYLWYIIEWLIRCLIGIFTVNSPYYDISFEREAFDNQNNLDYICNRKHFSWLKYLFK